MYVALASGAISNHDKDENEGGANEKTNFHKNALPLASTFVFISIRSFRLRCVEMQWNMRHRTVTCAVGHVLVF